MSAVTEAVLGLLVSVSSAVPVMIIAQRRQLRASSMYQLLASMSIGQTLVGALSALLGTLRVLETLPPSWLCVAGVFLRSALGTSTVTCFLALSVERYVTVVHGLRYFSILTDRRRWLLLAAQWLCTALFFLFGVSLRLSLGVGPAEEMCNHWHSIPAAYRITASTFVVATYTVSMGINVVVGWAGILQGRRIRQQQVSLQKKAKSMKLFRHQGYYVIMVMSLMFLVLIMPNSIVNVIQASGLVRLDTAHQVTTFMRLISMTTDGWVLALLCPKMKVEPVSSFPNNGPPSLLSALPTSHYVSSAHTVSVISGNRTLAVGHIANRTLAVGHADSLRMPVPRGGMRQSYMPDVEM